MTLLTLLDRASYFTIIYRHATCSPTPWSHMPIFYSHIVHRASEAIGLKDFNSESMEADDFRKVFLALQDSIRSLNSDPSLVFGMQRLDVHVSGSALTFKPYTTAELAIIAGGGTVDITDRVVDVRPTVAPNVYIGGSRLETVDPIDLVRYSDRYTCAWSPDWDQDQILFASPVADMVTVSFRKPVPVPASPTEEVRVPERFHEYLILSLAVSVGTKLGLTETLQPLMRSLAQELSRVTASNNYSRPVLLHVDLNRF